MSTKCPAEAPRALHFGKRVHQRVYVGFRTRRALNRLHDRTVHRSVAHIAAQHDVAKRRTLGQRLAHRQPFGRGAPHRVHPLPDLQVLHALGRVLARVGRLGHLQLKRAGPLQHAAQRGGRVHGAVVLLRLVHAPGQLACGAAVLAPSEDGQQHGPPRRVVIEQRPHRRLRAAHPLERVHPFATHALRHVAHGGEIHRVKRVVVVHLLLVYKPVVYGQRIELVVCRLRFPQVVERLCRVVSHDASFVAKTVRANALRGTARNRGAPPLKTSSRL